jgi:hypothetical protein
MNVFLLRDEELHITMMNPVMKILVSGVVFVTIFKVVVMIVVVEGVLVMSVDAKCALNANHTASRKASFARAESK